MGCEHSIPVPPDSNYIVVHDVRGSYLGEGTPAVPSKELPIKIVMQEKAFTSWSGDSFNIRTLDNKPYAGGLEIKGKAISLRDKMILSRSGEPLAVCLKQFLNFQETFRIYSLRPMLPNQKPSHDQRHDGKPLYQWAEVKDLAFSVQYTMGIWDGMNFKPTYATNNVGQVFGPQKVSVTRFGIDCAKLEQTNFEFMRGQVWKITICPGIDPCLMICFVAIVDEMKEKNNR